MSDELSCGIALIRLLEAWGIERVFGIPGVHTLELCRGLNASNIEHIQARNEQGAGMMAEGVARATGKPGVAIVISGPGVTNITTALGQAWADSLPMLVISAEAPSDSIGKGLGELHEITDQIAVTSPLTQLSLRILDPNEIPNALAIAFDRFASQRPRPVHLSIPIDVLELPVSDDDFRNHWLTRVPSDRPLPGEPDIEQAAAFLRNASAPVILVGGGATGTQGDLQSLAEKLGAPVISTTAGKGILNDAHPLAFGGGVTRPEAHELITASDCVLAVGTELSQPDSFDSVLDFRGKLIRVDIDPKKLNDRFKATVGIAADAGATVARLLEVLGDYEADEAQSRAIEQVARSRKKMIEELGSSERQHVKLLGHLRACAPENTLFSGDACQIMYTGAWAMPVYQPRQWFFPSGYCTLGCAVPTAIGAKLAHLELPVVALTGDGGFMFTVQELLTAAEQELAIPIILWDNGGYKQIRDDMDRANIRRIGVEGLNPDFERLATACHCNYTEPESSEQFQQAVATALDGDRPTLIRIVENSPWLIE